MKHSMQNTIAQTTPELLTPDESKIQGAIDFVNSTLQEHNTLAMTSAAAAAYTIGTFVEKRRVEKLEANKEVLNSTWGLLEDEEKPTTLRKLALSATSIAAVGSGVLGYVNTSAWIPEQSDEVQLPSIEVVVDKAGATLLDEQQDAIRIQELLALVNAESDAVNATAWNASGNVESTDIADSFHMTPFGPAPIDAAFNLATDQAEQRTEALQVGDSVTGQSVVVFTSGGRDIAGRSDSDSPVFVFNLSDEAEVPNLANVADVSGGQLYAADQFDEPKEQAELIQDIVSGLSPEDQESKDSSWPERAAAAAFGLAGVGAWRSQGSKLTSRMTENK